MGKRRDFLQNFPEVPEVPVWLLWKVYIYTFRNQNKEGLTFIRRWYILFRIFQVNKNHGAICNPAIQYIQRTIMPVFVILWWFLPSSKDVSTTIFFIFFSNKSQNRYGLALNHHLKLMIKIHLNLEEEFFTPRFHDPPAFVRSGSSSISPSNNFPTCEGCGGLWNRFFINPKKNGKSEHNQHIFFGKVLLLGMQCIRWLFEGFMIII